MFRVPSAACSACCLQLLMSTASLEAGRCWRSTAVSQGQHPWASTADHGPLSWRWLPSIHNVRAPANAGPGENTTQRQSCDTHQGPLVPQATSCPCPMLDRSVCWGWQQVSGAQPKARTGLHSSTETSWPHSSELQSCRRYWWLGANFHPSPSKTTPARRQEMSQQGQLRGSETQGCLSTCSSLEAQC